MNTYITAVKMDVQIVLFIISQQGFIMHIIDFVTILLLVWLVVGGVMVNGLLQEDYYHPRNPPRSIWSYSYHFFFGPAILARATARLHRRV